MRAVDTNLAMTPLQQQRRKMLNQTHEPPSIYQKKGHKNQVPSPSPPTANPRLRCEGCSEYLGGGGAERSPTVVGGAAGDGRRRVGRARRRLAAGCARAWITATASVLLHWASKAQKF